MHDDPDVQHGEALAETGFWGRRGAGCLVMARSTGRVLLPLRSLGVLEPQTWGTWGGAVSPGEDPAAAALRETAEETGMTHVPIDTVPLFVFRDAASGFAYHNFLVVVEDEFDPVLTWETERAEWRIPGDWPSPLHFGLAALLAHEESLQAIEKACAACLGPRV